MSQWRLVGLVVAVLAILAACIPMGSIFGSLRVVTVVVTGVLVGVGLAALGWWRAWGPVRLILVVVASLLVLAPALAAPERALGPLPTLEAYRIVIPAIWQSWRDILTIATPVGVGGGVLVAPLVLVLVGGAIAGSIMLRVRRAELAGLVPVAIAVWGIAFGPHEPWLPVLHATLVMSLVVILVSVVRQARRRRAAPRTLSTFWRRSVASLTVAAAALGCGLIGGAATLGERSVLRDEPSVVDPAILTSPLSAFRASFAPERRDEPVVTVTGMRDGDRLALATLDEYDGVTAGIGSASFVRMPAVAPRDGDVLGVTVQGLVGVGLPRVGPRTAVGFVGDDAALLQASVHRDAATGDVAVTEGLAPGDAYEVAIERADAPPALASLTPSGSTRLGAVPPADGVERLSRWTEDAQTPGERLAALADGLVDEGYLSHGVDEDEAASRAGHSLARIADLFDDAMVGDGEQYAVAAALLAEQLGFPARIVVGYAPGDVVEGGPTTVVAGDLDAWIEVSTQEAGWVPIAVTPERTDVPEQESTAPQPDAQPSAPTQPVLPEGGEEGRASPAEPVAPPAQSLGSTLLQTVLRVAALSLGGMLLLASPAIVLLVAKALRRRRRRAAASNAERVEGSWREFVDAAVDRGRPGQGRSTRLEYAAGDEERGFAIAVDAALFGRESPDDDEARRLWAAGDEIVRDIDRDRGRLARLRARLSPRSLLRR